MGTVERLRSDAEDHVEVANSCDCNPQDTVNWRHAETAHEAANEIEQLRARVAELESRASPASVPEDVIDAVTIALRKAFQLGQTYWQQADSDYISQNKKSDDTYAKFLVLSEEISALLATAPTPPVSEDRKDAERFRFMLDDPIRQRVRELFERLPVMSLSAARAAIDAAMQEDKP